MRRDGSPVGLDDDDDDRRSFAPSDEKNAAKDRRYESLIINMSLPIFLPTKKVEYFTTVDSYIDSIEEMFSLAIKSSISCAAGESRTAFFLAVKTVRQCSSRRD